MSKREKLEARNLELKREKFKEKAQRGVLGFTAYTFPGYQINWHHRIIADKLNAFVRKEIKRLMIFMPPRNGKSELGSRRLPAFIHGVNPDAAILAASYNSTLASDMCVDTQRIMDSDKYRDLFPGSLITPEGSKSQWARNAHEYEIMDRRGYYMGQGIGGAFTGRGADYLLIDDPIKDVKEAESEAFRESIWKEYNSTLYTRLESDGCILIIITRWHQDDLAGRLIAESKADPKKDQWHVVSFPGIKEDDSNPDDPRMIGEALWPEKYPVARLHSMKATMGERAFNALIQQNPGSAQGAMIKRSWLKYYREKPSHFTEMIMSVDCTFKDNKSNDYVVIQVWGKLGANVYLVHQVRGRMDIIGTIEAVRQVSYGFKQAFAKLVEDKANGPAVVALLKNEIPGLISVNPEASKTARVAAILPMWNAGNVYLPDPSIAPWIGDFVEENCAFPAAAHDDQVDAMSQALSYFYGVGSSTFTENMIPSSMGLIAPPISGASW